MEGTYDASMRRFFLAMVLFATVAGCGVVPVAEGRPVPPGPLGPIVPNDAGGPPIECRGVPREACTSFGQGRGEPDVVRYIVTCTAVCTPEKGEVRIDILGASGTTRSAGSGQYSSGEAVPAEPTPPPSDLGPS
jgi:hypothetical protein